MHILLQRDGWVVNIHVNLLFPMTEFPDATAFAVTAAAVKIASAAALPILAEFRSCARRPRRHDVPADAPAAEMVERRELAGQVVGLAIGRRGGSDQADAIGQRCEGAEQRQRFEFTAGRICEILAKHDMLRKRERAMQGFRSPGGLQRFVAIFSAIRNLFVPPQSRRCALATQLHRLRAMAHWKAIAGVTA